MSHENDVQPVRRTVGLCRSTLLVLGGLALGACGGEPPASEEGSAVGVVRHEAPLIAAAPGKAVPDSYIVVMKEGASARSAAVTAGAAPRYVFEALNGFAGKLTAAQVSALRKHPGVAYIEQDQVVSTSAVQDLGSSHDLDNLDRLDQRGDFLDSKYYYTYTGAGVHAYILDTGIDAQHSQFRRADGTSRARNVLNTTGDGKNTDCNGHGTHVAGTVGGRKYGVAKQVLLDAVKVIGCDGNGTTSGVIAGVDWVRQNHVKPAVANMSIGGSFSQAMNDAVQNLSDAGVFVAVAAGNENDDACNHSPASAGLGSAVTTVGGSYERAQIMRIDFSNWGRCVDIFFTAEWVWSAWIGPGDTESNYLNGTSMATPHVTGVAALVKDRRGDVSSDAVWSEINSASTKGVVVDDADPSRPKGNLLFKPQAW